MKNLIKRLNQKKILYIIPLLITIYLLSTFSLVYRILKLSSIENFLRYSFCSLIIVLFAYLFLVSFQIIKKGKNLIITLFLILLTIVITIQLFVSNTVSTIYRSIDKMNKLSTTYTSSLISMKDSNITDMESISNYKIGMIDDNTNVDGYIIPSEVIEEYNLNDNNEIIEYDSYISLISKLYEGDLDLIFVPTNYPTIVSSLFDEDDKYNNIQSETSIIITETKDIEKENTSNLEIDEPFTLLLIGVDSEKETLGNSAYNSDVLMLITFNPKTYNATIMSVPRDTYTPITCMNNTKGKITSSGWYGNECVINSVEKLTGIEVDQYVKINFKGLVKIIDSLGGINVDVPYSFCEQDSNREWGENTIYVKEGYQLLNGEEALALSRNRKNNWAYCSSEYTSGVRNDIVRGKNQQIVIMGMLDKLKDIDSLNDIYELLDLVEYNVDTSLNINQILSFYNIAKKILINNSVKDTISFEQLSLSGYSTDLYSAKTGGYSNVYIYYEGSLNDISNAMEINLELQEPTLVKTFEFSINEKYAKTQIGIGSYNETHIKVFERLVGKTETYARNYARANNISIIVNYEDVIEPEKDNTVIHQSIPYAYNIKDITTSLTITIGKYN